MLLALLLLFRTKYQELKNHSKSSKRMATLLARNISLLTKIIKYTENSVESKVEGSVTMFISCHNEIANLPEFQCQLGRFLASKLSDHIRKL